MQKLLTEPFVRSARAADGRRLEVADLRCAGLSFRVTGGGAKSWSLRFRDPHTGKLTRATIGAYPDVSLHTARERALELRREVASGVNPVEKKRRDREESASRTFEVLAARYMIEHARRHKKTAEADQRNLNLHVLPHWRTRRFDGIGRGDVIALCEGLVAKGSPIQANRVQALISKMFSFALDAELVDANPCARLKKRSKERRATRVLSDDEIRLFWRRIGDPPNSARMGQALRLVLLTGVRVSELAGAEIREFERLHDADQAAWTIPAARSKNGRAHVVPLSEPARRIVADLIERAGVTEREGATARPLLALPGNPRRPIDGHALSVAMIRFGNALRSAKGGEGRGEPGVETWTLERPSAHDLRRTLATRLAALGVPAEDVSACLNHVRTSVTARHYDQYDRAREKRTALRMWAEEVSNLTGELNRCGAGTALGVASPPARSLL